jgi:two-component system, sensor histidine kinase PdtaS
MKNKKLLFLKLAAFFLNMCRNLLNVYFSPTKVFFTLYFVLIAFLSLSQNHSTSQYDSIRLKIIHESDQAVALQYAFELLDEANKLADSILIGRANLEISYSYNSMGNYTNALDFAIQAARKFENQNNFDELAMAYNAISSIYQYLKNYKLAIQYLNKAINIHSLASDGILLSDDLLNIGEIYRLMNRYDSALYYFQNALSLYQKNQKIIGIAYAKCNIGLSLFQSHVDTTGLTLINESLVLLDSLGEFYPICFLYIEMGKKQLIENNYTKAKNYALLAYKIALKNSFNDQLIDALSLLSDLAQRENDYFGAFRYYKECQYFKDSLFNDKVASQMAEKRTEYEVSRKETEIVFLKKITQAQRIASVFLVISLIFIVAFAIFLWHTSRNRKITNKLLAEQNHELDQKNHIIFMALEEKEVLMREIHHRVKNNLQIISSLINLQSIRIDDPGVKEIFDEMQRRIMAISSIHQKLYQSDSVTFINMQDYIGEIIESIHSAFGNNQIIICYEISIQNVNMNIDYAVSLGLIVNELATNSYKYAFKPEVNNHLIVKLIQVETDYYQLTLHDNGPGIPEGMKIEQCQSLGLRMVMLLTRQIKGTFKYLYNQGAEFSITFQIK